jgi:hypothetical protein
MDKPKGKTVAELVFADEHVEGQVDFKLKNDNIYVHLAEKDDQVGMIQMPGNSQQRTRFGVVKQVGPDVTPEEARPGDVVAIQFHVGSWLNAPAFGFRDQSHVVCKANQIMFTLHDKE